MADLSTEVAGMRGELGAIREGVGYLTSRVDSLIGREAEGRVAQRRITIGVAIAAASIVLGALALVARLLVEAL